MNCTIVIFLNENTWDIEEKSQCVSISLGKLSRTLVHGTINPFNKFKTSKVI